MDLASTIWVIDRTIGVEMGVGTQQGLPQGQFYYFQAEEAEIFRWLSNPLTKCPIAQRR